MYRVRTVPLLPKTCSLPKKVVISCGCGDPFNWKTEFYCKLVPEKSFMQFFLHWWQSYFVHTLLFDSMCSHFKTIPQNCSFAFAVVVCSRVSPFNSFCFRTWPTDVVLTRSLLLKSLHITQFHKTLAVWLEIRGKKWFWGAVLWSHC